MALSGEWGPRAPPERLRSSLQQRLCVVVAPSSRRVFPKGPPPRDPRSSSPRCPVLETPPPSGRGGSPAHTCPAPPVGPPARRSPARLPVPVGARPDYLSSCPGAAGVLRLLSRCLSPRPGAAARPATPCPAATRRAERTGRAGMETRWLGRSERWTRGCLGCAPTAAASYPRARRRQAGPRGLRAGL